MTARDGVIAELGGRVVIVPFLVLGTAAGFIIGHTGGLPDVIAGLVVGASLAAGLFLLGWRRSRRLSVKVHSWGAPGTS
jgi:hypothetical protein